MEIDLPPGWEGRIFTRPPAPTPQGVPHSDPEHESSLPVLHAANFGLPVAVGDFGGGAVELMGNGHVFVAVVDYGPEAAHTALFAANGVPMWLRPDQFRPDTLQRTLPGQSGMQHFFTSAGRGLCLYVVLGAHLFRARQVPLVNEALRTLRIS